MLSYSYVGLCRDTIISFFMSLHIYVDTVAMSVSDNPTNPQVTEDSEDKENANVGPSNTAYRAVRKESDDSDVFTPVRFKGMETGINHIYTSSVTRNSSQQS